MDGLGVFDIMIGCIWTALVTLFITPTIVRVAYFKNIFDIPDYRKVHTLPTPRGGGFAVFTSFLVGLVSFIHMEEDAQKILGPTMLMFLLGFKDDMAGAVAKRKLIIQLLAASMVVLVIDLRITSLHGLLGIYGLPPVVSYLISYLAILAITNAFNLIDGINGLLGSVSIFACMGLGSLLYPYRVDLASMAFILSASLIAFLRYNLRKPQIFMGDSGSLACGFLLSCLVIMFLKEEPSSKGIPAMMALLFVPIFDVLRTCMVRLYRGRSILSPGRDHTHHALMEAGLSQFQTLLILVTLNAAVYLLCITLSFLNINILALGLVTLGSGVHLLIWITKRPKMVTLPAGTLRSSDHTRPKSP